MQPAPSLLKMLLCPIALVRMYKHDGFEWVLVMIRRVTGQKGYHAALQNSDYGPAPAARDVRVEILIENTKRL